LFYGVFECLKRRGEGEKKKKERKKEEDKIAAT
jgi:hypothetical protein